MTDESSEHAIPGVHALILTHNSPGDLARCLRSIREQTAGPARVTVIDNGSSPALQRSGVEVLRLEENGGPAGGWAAGLRHFLRCGLSRAWLLDDDCEAERACLERLFESAADIAVPYHERPSGTGGFFPSWTGVLLTRSAVERLGLPREEFFWWCEDTEYLQHRPRNTGVSKKNVEGARVTNHATRRAMGQAPWKTYYESRNGTYYRLYVQTGQPVLRRARKLTLALLAVGRRAWKADRHAAQARAFTLGVAHGILGKLGKTMDPDDSRVRPIEGSAAR